MAGKKRPLEMMHVNESCTPMSMSKRAMISREVCSVQCSVDFKPPTQQQELGIFWINSVSPKTAALEPANRGHEFTRECQGDRQLSISLGHPYQGPCAGADDDDMQDTATSSSSAGGSSGSAPAQQSPASGHGQPPSAASGVGEEDSISTGPIKSPATAGFSFARRPDCGIDLSSLYCWENLHNLLEGM